MNCLPESFYRDEATLVARRLLGQRLVRHADGKRTSGLIVETEAYMGEEDLACHAHVGKTKRNAMLYDQAGKAYVYFTYGMHYLLNLVTEKEGNPCAVLIRGASPVDGIAEMEARRKKRGAELTNGPAKLCQAMCIDKSLNGWDLTCGRELWLENYKNITAKRITATPRIGIPYAREEHRAALWRFLTVT